jgi:hypothetical protein
MKLRKLTKSELAWAFACIALMTVVAVPFVALTRPFISLILVANACVAGRIADALYDDETFTF